MYTISFDNSLCMAQIIDNIHKYNVKRGMLTNYYSIITITRTQTERPFYADCLRE